MKASLLRFLPNRILVAYYALRGRAIAYRLTINGPEAAVAAYGPSAVVDCVVYDNDSGSTGVVLYGTDIRIR